jgi:20S proteasome alpha/beta subunit
MEKSRMTIDAGFVCMDGIILAADTQETIPGYTKNSTEKIRIWGDQGLGIAITGAGETDLIETIGPEIERAICWDYSPKEVRFPDDVKEVIRKAMVSAFLKYLRPYASFPKDDRPWCELLVVVSVKNEVNEYESLFKVSGVTVREITYGAECIGSGLILAKSLIERFYSSFINMDQAILAACYVMYQTKSGPMGVEETLISSCPLLEKKISLLRLEAAI